MSRINPSYTRWRALYLSQDRINLLALNSGGGGGSSVDLPLITARFSPLALTVKGQISLPLPEFNFTPLAQTVSRDVNLGLVEFELSPLAQSIEGQITLPLPGFEFAPLAFPTQDQVNLDLVTFTFSPRGVFRGPVVALLGIVNVYETWLEHFSNHSWTTIQDQINAGYTYFALPGGTSGMFEDKFDFGAIFENVILNVTFSKDNVIGTILDDIEIAVSDDDVTYTAFTSGASYFATSVRYAKVRLNLTSADDNALALYSNLRCALSVKLSMDSGTVEVLAADAATGGTEVTFNIAFKDVNSITTTARSTEEPLTAFQNFVDAPNPTSFKIIVVDTSGNFRDATVDWKARGVT